MSKLVVIGDRLVSSQTLKEAGSQLDIPGPIEIEEFNWYPDLTKEQFQEKILTIEKYGPAAVDLPDGILDAVEDADYLLVHIAPVSESMIQKAQKLKLIGTCRGGLEHIDLEAIKSKNIPLLHVIRNAEPVAEFTLGLMLAETRNIARGHKDVMSGKWVKQFPNDLYKTTLNQQKIGMIGLGYIGKLVVKKLNALDIPVCVYDPYVDKEKILAEGLQVEFMDIQDVFKTADIISLHMRVSPETTNMIDESLIRLMKPSGYLINTARAAVLKKEDLIYALKEKKIAGAALDVIWEEPIKKDDPLLKLDNITLTPHIAGDTVDAIPRSPFLLKDEINSYLSKGTSDMLINL